MGRRSTKDIDARIRAIVECTVREQGFDLEVRDPVALHTVAAMILAARRDKGDRDRPPPDSEQCPAVPNRKRRPPASRP